MRNMSKSIIKGIVVSVLSTIMTFTTILPTTNYLTYAGDNTGYYKEGEIETLGIKNLNSPNWSLDTKGTLPSIAYGNENNENLKRDTPKNYTKFTDDRVEMYETIEWGWDDEGKEAGEKEHHILYFGGYTYDKKESKSQEKSYGLHLYE